MPIPLGVLAVAGAGAAAGGAAYEWLETVTIGSGGQASVTFSNLNSTYGSTYQHLQIRGVARSNRATFAVETINMKVNTNSMTKYHRLWGDGGSVASNIDASIAEISTDVAATGSFGAFIIDILDPFETTKNKTIRALSGSVSADAGAFTGKQIQLASTFLDSTSAIDSIELDPTFGSLLSQYTRISLYGLRSA